MSEAKAEFVNEQGFTINLPSVGTPVAITTKSDEIVVIVSLTLRPRDNVMNVSFNVTTSGDGAPMAGLDKDATFDVSRYWRANVAHDEMANFYVAIRNDGLQTIKRLYINIAM